MLQPHYFAHSLLTSQLVYAIMKAGHVVFTDKCPTIPLDDTSLHRQPHCTEWPKSLMFVLLSPYITFISCGCFLHTQSSKRETYLQLVGNVQKHRLTFWRSIPATGIFDIFSYLVPEAIIFITTAQNFSGRITYFKTRIADGELPSIFCIIPTRSPSNHTA